MKKGDCLKHASSFKVEVMKEAKAPPITDHQNRDFDADADADPRSRSCSRSVDRREGSGLQSHVCGLLNHRSPAAVTCKIFAFCRMTIKCLNEWHNTRPTIDALLLVIDHRGNFLTG